MPREKINRKQQILQSLAMMLQANPGARITTANLAREVGVSEAALYRHFPSKARMFEGLIEFIEESLFSRINRFQRGEADDAGDALAPQEQCGAILWLILSFAERNPGFARLLVGDALQGETERLRARMRQVFDRLEAHLRQSLRAHQEAQTGMPVTPAAVGANLLLAAAEGRINQFVRGEFRNPPTAGWEEQWRLLSQAVLGTRPV
ncbi:MAG: nucleoid occlusion factor SlmA [Pseudomonadales bacterium]